MANNKILQYLLRIKNSRILYLMLISAPIIALYVLSLSKNFGGVSWGDADFFFANAEAFRKTILIYHQFPWWNPWIGGGIPLYPDPQFGLVSIQSVLVLLFGTVIGWKLALISYVLVAFHGLRKLLLSVFKTPELIAVLLSMTWGFSLFWGFRASAGHFTFFTLAFLPWVLLAYWSLEKTQRAWLYLGLTIGLAINAAPHNTTIMLLVILVMILVIDLAVGQHYQGIMRTRKVVLQLTKAATVALLLSLHKLFFTYKYSSSNSHERTNDPEEFIGWRNIFDSLFGNDIAGGILPSGWGKPEALVGLGIGVFIALVLILGYGAYKIGRHRGVLKLRNAIGPQQIIVIICCALLFLLALGNFSDISFYGLMRELPVLEDTRVAPRWLIPLGFFLLVALGMTRIPKNLNVIVAGILLLNLTFLAMNSVRLTGSTFIFTEKASTERSNFQPPAQTIQWHAPRNPELKFDDNLFVATKSNVGQISTNLTPFFDTKQGPTERCDEINAPDCSFVLTKNASIIYWSPNKIVLKREAPGSIRLNMNTSRYWAVNGKYPFAGQPFATPLESFIINEPSSTIIISFSPPGSFTWFKSKF